MHNYDAYTMPFSDCRTNMCTYIVKEFAIGCGQPKYLHYEGHPEETESTKSVMMINLSVKVCFGLMR